MLLYFEYPISKNDTHFTNRIYKVGKLIPIEVVDHLISTEEG
ncbi:JAB domain-containing protein [uncultured Dokdonia sp.]